MGVRAARGYVLHMVYVLHYAPDNASLILRLALEELGVPYRTELVDRSVAAQNRPDYRAKTPTGLIPALETPDGPLFETAAALLWLADRHGRLAPPPDSPGRAAFLPWLFFTSNTLHAMLRMTFYPAKYVGASPAAQAALLGKLHDRMTDDMTVPKALVLLDARYRALPQAAWHDADPKVLDYYVAALMRWCALYPVGAASWFDISDYPALRTMAAGIEPRAAVRAAQVAEGLGPTPFTAPSYANPPEGSAT